MKSLSFETLVTMTATKAIQLSKEGDMSADQYIGEAMQQMRILNNPINCATIIANSPSRNAIDNIERPDSTNQIPKQRSIESADKALALISFWAMLSPVTEMISYIEFTEANQQEKESVTEE